MNPAAEHELSIELEQDNEPLVLKNVSSLPSASEPIQVDGSVSQSAKERSLTLSGVHDGNESSTTSSTGAAATSIKQHTMRTPVSTITQEVINHIGMLAYLCSYLIISICLLTIHLFHLGYYTKHEQEMQNMMKEQAKKAEELIRTIVNQAKVHCRRDTLWQRLQQNSSAQSLNYYEFCELLTLSWSEPVSTNEPQLIPLLAQPVSWYQGLAKLLLTRYPDTQRHFSSPDGSSQHVVILNQRLPATAIMLSWDLNADRAVSPIIDSSNSLLLFVYHHFRKLLFRVRIRVSFLTQ